MQTAMDKVTLTSADGTTLKYGIPNDLANSGIKSIGNKSIKFMKKIHMNTVNESGAINLLFCLKILVTVPWTNSKIISRKHWSLVGTPLVVFFEAYLNKIKNKKPRITVNPSESRFKV